MKFSRFSGIVAAATLFSMVSIPAIHATLKLLDPEYSFGTFREADGTKRGHARLVNVGDYPTTIADVRPSCGCTGAYYDDGVIAPGDTTIVSFDYNPTGRPGNFNKTVKVKEAGSNELQTIRLSGTVVGTPQTLSRNYPFEAGKIRLSTLNIDLNNVKSGAGRHAFVRIVNQSMDTVMPQWNNNDKALSINVTPTKLAPGQIATLGVYFNSKFESRTGEVDYIIPVHADNDTTVNVVIHTVVHPDSVAMQDKSNKLSK